MPATNAKIDEPIKLICVECKGVRVCVFVCVCLCVCVCVCVCVCAQTLTAFPSTQWPMNPINTNHSGRCIRIFDPHKCILLPKCRNNLSPGSMNVETNWWYWLNFLIEIKRRSRWQKLFAYCFLSNLICVSEKELLAEVDSEFIVKLYRTFQVQTVAESNHSFVMHFEINALRQKLT